MTAGTDRPLYAALLDRLTHLCNIFEMNGESYRFRESMKAFENQQCFPVFPTPGVGPFSTRKWDHFARGFPP